MKKILFSGLICIISFFCTGCVKFSYNVDIDKKGNVNFSTERSFKSPLLKSNGFKSALQSDANIIISKYKNNGQIAEEFSDGEYYGVRTKQNGLSLSKASENLPEGFVQKEDKPFSVHNGLVKHHYKIHLFYNLKNAINDTKIKAENFKTNSSAMQIYTNNADNIVISRMKVKEPGSGRQVYRTEYASGKVVLQADNTNVIEITPPYAELTIKIPAKATNNNATTINGKNEYIWDLSDESQDTEIILEYDTYDFSSLIIIISIIAAVTGAAYLNKKLHGDGTLNGL